ncbi:MAG: PAS domain S-box protein [Bacteroidales bacterium]|nr:PAS domain S-box protein [Bacteroidales bacterium]MCF8405632.1 PAS domain S-box protein [Bacteroidales bacterium]
MKYQDIYNVYFHSDNISYGSITIITFNNSPSIDSELIEAFIAQVTVFIQKQHSQKKLKKSDERYRTLFENSSDPNLIIDNEVFIECNQATIDYLGYDDMNDVIGKKPWEHSPEIQPDNIPSEKKAKQMIKEAIIKGNNRFEWVHLHADGSHLWVDVMLTYIPSVDRIYTIWRDISKQKASEIKLKESEEQLKLALFSAHEGMWEWRLETNAISFDKNAQRMLGFSEGDFKPEADFVLDLIHPEDKEEALNTIRQYFKGMIDHYSNEYRLRKKNGKYIWVWSVGKITSWNKNGDPNRFIGVLRDINEKKKTEKELQVYRNQLEELVNKRTAELEKKNQELERFNHLFVGREFRIKELRDKIKMLEEQISNKK